MPIISHTIANDNIHRHMTAKQHASFQLILPAEEGLKQLERTSLFYWLMSTAQDLRQRVFMRHAHTHKQTHTLTRVEECRQM